MQPLPRHFYDRDTATVARDLLGCLVVHVVDGVAKTGQIIETEAYLGPHDRASHSARGQTPRNQVMFGPPGHAYVYFIYGMHFCLNVVTEPVGHGAAVLLRALAPVANLPGRTNGPALLCRALGIDRRHNGHDLLSPDLFLTAAPEAARAEKQIIIKRPRIGVDYAGAWAKRQLRFYLKGNPHVSKK